MFFLSSAKKYLALLNLLLFSSQTLQKAWETRKGQRVPEQEVKEERVRSQRSTKTAVISHELCSSCLSKDDLAKIGHGSSLQDVHTYAEMEYDLQDLQSSSFTICATTFSTTTNLNPMLFSLLDVNNNQWFQAQILQLSDGLGKRFYYSQFNHFGNADTMPIGFNQWVRSCIAIDIASGWVQWVARGELVDNSTFAEIKDQKYLTGKIILGAHYHPYVAKWLQISNKVTNVNIFSSSLSVEKMQGYTQEKECGRWGDFLSWDEMHWNLHGDTVQWSRK